MPGISRDPDKARRQLQGLAGTNTRLADRLKRGELPGFKGPLEGTEHLHPEAAAATPPPAPGSEPYAGHVPGTSPAPAPPAPDAGHVPGTSPAPSRAPIAEVGSYQEPPDEPTPPEPEPEPDGGPAGPGPAAPEPDPPGARRRGPLGELAQGFFGRV